MINSNIITQSEQTVGDKVRFSDDSNIHYTYPAPTVEEDDQGFEVDPANLLIGDKQTVVDMIHHHSGVQNKRLKELLSYYKGENITILNNKRRREDHLADHRATHNYAKYVSQFMQGYMVGVPLKTTYAESEEIDKKLKNLNRENDADEHNSDLVLDQSIFGRAYELLYRGADDITKFKAVEVFETFIVYDDTVERSPIAGVRYITSKFGKEETRVFIYTKYCEYRYKLEEGKLLDEKKKEHQFGGVPLVEYENNKHRQGDFEDVLNLIDLYDASQSDTANYMTDLNDAMLVIVGNLKIDLDDAKDMKEKNTMMLEVESDEHGNHVPADAKYIYKQYDVSGTEAYKSRVENDIHKHTNTPNMNDDNFGGVQSGEAMKYKLFGLEQVRATKERMFKKSLRDRYRLVNNIMKVASEGDFDVNDISITFTPNLPKSEVEAIDSFIKLGGQLSEETKLSILPFVENPQEEIDRIKAESPTEQEGQSMYDEFMQVRQQNAQIQGNDEQSSITIEEEIK